MHIIQIECSNPTVRIMINVYVYFYLYKLLFIFYLIVTDNS